MYPRSIPIWAKARETLLLLPLWVRGRRRLTFQTISAKTMVNNTQYITDSRPICYPLLTKMLWTVDQNIMVKVLAECQLTYCPSVNQ